MDIAIETLLKEMTAKGALKSRLTAKLVGGANMYHATMDSDIGQDNVTAAKVCLRQEKIAIVGELVDEVKAVAAVSLSKLHPLKIKKPKEVKKQTTEGGQIIIIGASTGGPQTLAVILPEIPASFSLPVLVLQHISNLFFTESMSEHLNKQCQLKVKVAENGEAIHAGFIYFAPPGFLTHFRKTQKQVTFQLVETTDDLHRPNIDDTMESAVEIYGDQVIGIILSGMGRDGLQGMQKIKLAGGKTLVQDESSLIFGMSKAVVDAGIADQILPPHFKQQIGTKLNV